MKLIVSAFKSTCVIFRLFFSAREVMVMDSKSIHLKEFQYDGLGGDGVFFWVGHGPQPSSKGIKVPDELGYLEPLNAYGRQVSYIPDNFNNCR